MRRVERVEDSTMTASDDKPKEDRGDNPSTNRTMLTIRVMNLAGSTLLYSLFKWNIKTLSKMNYIFTLNTI